MEHDPLQKRRLQVCVLHFQTFAWHRCKSVDVTSIDPNIETVHLHLEAGKLTELQKVDDFYESIGKLLQRNFHLMV